MSTQIPYLETSVPISILLVEKRLYNFLYILIFSNSFFIWTLEHFIFLDENSHCQSHPPKGDVQLEQVKKNADTDPFHVLETKWPKIAS